MVTIFIVVGSTGEFSDYTEWNVAAYASQAEAEKHTQAANVESVKLAQTGDYNLDPVPCKCDDPVAYHYAAKYHVMDVMMYERFEEYVPPSVLADREYRGGYDLVVCLNPETCTDILELVKDWDLLGDWTAYMPGVKDFPMHHVYNALGRVYIRTVFMNKAEAEQARVRLEKSGRPVLSVQQYKSIDMKPLKPQQKGKQ